MSDAGTDVKRASLSPLGVVSLFLSFSEVVLGYAVTQTEGIVQGSLTAFVIIFPTVVFAAFYRILSTKPYNFYPPADFGPSTDVAGYVDAISRANRVNLGAESIKGSVDQALSLKGIEEKIDDLIAESGGGQVSDDVIEQIVKYVKESVDEGIDSSFVQIDSRPMMGSEGEVWEEIYDPEMPTHIFLDQIWYRIKARPYSYEKDWILRDASSGRIFYDIGRGWAAQRGLRDDKRTIREIGVAAKSKIEVLDPSSLSPLRRRAA